MKLTISAWPRAVLNATEYDLPLPEHVGNNEHRGCTLGSRDECADCRARREKADERLVAQMKAQRNGPVSRIRPKIQEAWET